MTKFRAPRLRGDTVARPKLLAGLVASVETNPLTVVCAPGGSGKTTLLSQFAAVTAAHPQSAVVWISLDADDDYPDRFYAALIEAVDPLHLDWSVDPRSLIAGVGGEGAGRRNALAALVNALCTMVGRRIVIVFDDLHRLACADVFRMIESLIERLPEHVAMVIGSRVEPPLPLARWRAHSELGELTLADLRFTDQDALALAQLRSGVGADEQAVRAAIVSAGGWAVGVSMLLQAAAGPRPAFPSGSPAGTVASRRHLFAYLAEEILAELPPDLQRFALECSILDELSPGLCSVVTGRSDAADVLDALYQRNLFLSIIDETVPVLRFHDLLRDFLEHEVNRRCGFDVRELHERAARAETNATRAIHHWLKAGNWQAAIALIAREGQPRLAAGSIGLVEDWLQRIPEEHRRADARIGFLRGACAWLRWDWATARRELESAIDSFEDPGQLAPHIRSLIQLIDALNSSGDATAAMQRLEQAANLPLEDFGRAEVALLRAWCLARNGTDNDAVFEAMSEFIGYAERDPARICPATAGRIHCMLIGLPGIAQVFERFAALSESVYGPVPAPWHVASLVVGAWGEFWRGDREAVARSIARAEAIYQQFGGIRLVGERVGQLKAIFHAASGELSEGVAIARRHIEGLQTPEVAWHRDAWLRSYRHAVARMYWMAGDSEGFMTELPHLLAPRTRAEWPFIDTAANVVRGLVAIFRGDWQSAASRLQEACDGHAHYRMSTVYVDPRISLAYVQLKLGQPEAAWRTFEPVYSEVVEQHEYGLLILDAREHVLAVLDALPAAVARSPETVYLRRRLDQWNPRSAGTSLPRHAGPLGALSEREREVLERVATGASNKQIARELALSLHTVKRHLANILDKLDCDSRGQAADMYRRSGR